MKRERKNGRVDKRNLLLDELESGRNLQPSDINGCVLSLNSKKANNPYPPTSGTMSPWKDNSRGYEVALANVVTNGDFSNGTTGWVGVDSLVSGRGMKTATSQYQSMRRDLPTVVGRKYLAVAQVEGSQSNYFGSLANAPALTQSGVQMAYHIFTATATTTSIGIGDFRTSGWTPFYIDDMMLIDLTTPFGTTREPSISDIQRAMEDAGTTYWSGTKTLRFRNNAVLSNFAGTATSGWVQEWIECQTGQDTELVNLLANAGDMIDANLNNSADGWAYGGASAVSCVGNEAVFLPTQQNGQMYNNSPTAPDGAGVYAYAYVKSTKNTSKLVLSGGIVSATVGTHSGGGAFEFLSSTATKVGAGAMAVAVFDSASSGWANITVKQAGVIYKTGVFASMTQPEMDRIVQRAIAAYGYINTKTLKLARRWMLRLDGTDDFSQIINSAALDFGTGDFAIAMTIRMLTMGTGKRLISKRISGGAGYEIHTSDSNQACVGYYLGDGTNTRFGQIGVTSVLKQYSFASHVFVFRRGATVQHYVNGVYVAESPSIATVATSIDNSNPTILGKSALASSGYANMDIADANIYKDTFDINQILKAEWQIARDYIA